MESEHFWQQEDMLVAASEIGIDRPQASAIHGTRRFAIRWTMASWGRPWRAMEAASMCGSVVSLSGG